MKNAEISDKNQENKSTDTTTTNTKTNTKIATKITVKPVKKFDSKGNVVKEKGKGLGKKGVEVPNAPAAWGGFKRHRAKKLGKK